jgi:hypothetical protein
MKRNRAWLILVIGLIFLVIVDRIYVFNISAYSLHSTTKYSEKYKNDEQSANSPMLAFVADIEEFIDTHEKLFIVLATIAIAWFTFTLWKATEGLFAMSKTQAIDMRESLRISRESADSAKKTVETMRDTAEKQLRAYISIEKSQIISVPILLSNRNFKIAVFAKNYGQTPAYDLTFSANVTVTNPINMVLPAAIDMPMPSIVGPTAYTTRVLNTAALTRAEIDDCRSMKKCLCVYGEISYRDAFNETRHTSYRFVLGGSAGFDSEGVMAYAAEGNDAD